MTDNIEHNPLYIDLKEHFSGRLDHIMRDIETIQREIKDLERSRDELRGKANMSSVFWASALAIIAVAISAAGLIVTSLR